MAKGDPAYLAVAYKYVGTREIPGRTNNNKLIAFLNTAAKFNAVVWRDDEMPWCGGFLAAVMVEAGVEPVKIAARARSWENWGANLNREKLAPGAVLVFTRNGGGHVGLYVGEDATHYHVLGGNQSNGVNVSRIAKSRLSASRWQRGLPVIRGPVRMTNTAGVPVTTNEA